MIGKDSIAKTDIGRVLEALGKSQRTGMLVFEDQRDVKRIYLVDGAVVGVESTDPADSLGRRLELSGALDPTSVKAAEETALVTSESFIDVLYDSGALTDEQLEAAAQMQAFEVVWSLFLWHDGNYSFAPEQLPDEVSAPVSLELDELLDEGLRRRGWVEEQRRSLPDELCWTGRVAADQLSALERELVSPLGRSRRIDDLRREARLTECEVLRAVSGALGRGAIAEASGDVRAFPASGHSVRADVQAAPDVAASSAPSPTASPDELVAAARMAMDHRSYAEGLELFRRAEASRPDDPHLRQLRASAEEVYCQVLAGRELPLEARLMRSCSPEAVRDSFQPFAYRLLGLVDGHHTVREILNASGVSQLDAIAGLLELKQWGLVELDEAAG